MISLEVTLLASSRCRTVSLLNIANYSADIRAGVIRILSMNLWTASFPETCVTNALMNGV